MVRHICIVTTSYPVTSDGQEAAGAFVADFAQKLSAHCKVTVVAPALQSASQQLNANLTVRYFQVPKLPLSLLKVSNPACWPAIAVTLARGQRCLAAAVAEQDIDFIFSFWVLPSGYWARAVAAKHQIRYATWALGSDIWSLSRLPVVGRILRQVLLDATVNFADGYQLAQDVSAISARQCHFLASTRQLNTDQTKVLSRQPPYQLVFLGRWHPNKGIDILLTSLAALGEEDWQLIKEVRIAGGGPLAPLVEAACRTLQAAGRPVELSGYLDQLQATAFITAADFILLPSRIESIPVIFSDAMQCRTPVITMPVGDLPRLLQQYQVGIVAKQLDAAAFTQAIRQALQHAPSQFEPALTAAAQQFNPAQIIQRFLELINAPARFF